MFNKPKTAKPVGSESPYLVAREEYLERYGDHIKNAKNWRWFGLISGGTALVLAFGMVAVAQQHKVVPYVVQVDQLSTVLPVGPATQAARPDGAIIRAAMGEWIVNVRSVHFDATATREKVLKAYALLEQSGAGFQTVTEFMKNNDPFKRAQNESVAVEVQSVLPVGANSWRVEWLEVRRGRDGTELGRQQWSGVIETKIVPATDEATILTNPLGIYVNAVSWSPRT